MIEMDLKEIKASSWTEKTEMTQHFMKLHLSVAFHPSVTTI